MSRLVERLGPGGKDVVVVVGSSELSVPSRVVLPPPEPAPGLIRPDGTINWACPCLGGMATGPCGKPFREAFSCFHYSDAEPKGSDCYEKFSEMQSCMSEYPELYSKDEDEELSAALDTSNDQSALPDTSNDQSALPDTSNDQSDTAPAADSAVLAH